MSRDGYEIISKNVKNYHFRNEVFSCFPLEHNIPNVVVCNFYNFVCWNAAVNREIVREKYQKYTYSNRHHLHGSRTSVGLETSFSKPLRWHVCSQRSINKQNNWIEVSLPEDYWLLPKRFSSMHLHGFCWCDRKLLFITSLDHFQIYIFPNNLYFYDKHLCWQISVNNVVKLYQKSIDFHK